MSRHRPVEGFSFRPFQFQETIHCFGYRKRGAEGPTFSEAKAKRWGTRLRKSTEPLVSMCVLFTHNVSAGHEAQINCTVDEK